MAADPIQETTLDVTRLAKAFNTVKNVVSEASKHFIKHSAVQKEIGSSTANLVVGHEDIIKSFKNFNKENSKVNQQLRNLGFTQKEVTAILKLWISEQKKAEKQAEKDAERIASLKKEIPKKRTKRS